MPHETTSGRPPARPGGEARRLVLVADDDTFTRRLVRLSLERDGYAVVEAATGLEAVTLAERERPSVIVTDMHMPEMSGGEVMARLKSTPSIASVPVLVLSADETPGARVAALAEGAADYILKPVHPRVLSARVGAAVSRCGDRAQGAPGLSGVGRDGSAAGH